MPGSRQRPKRLAADVALPVLVALVMALTISVAQEDTTRSADVGAYVLGVAVALLLLARRRWPLGILVGSIGLLLIYYALDYPAFPPAVPLAAATYFAALHGKAPAAGVLLGAVVVFGAAWQTVSENSSLADVVGNHALTDVALFAAVLALGEAVRHRRAWAQEVRERLARVEHNRRSEAERRAEQERLHIARELHDVLAHTIASLNVQAGVAADTIDDDPAQAKHALVTIRRQAREAVAELRVTIGLLRGRAVADAERTPAPGLGDLDGLVETATAAGVRTSVAVAGDARALSGATDLTAYRIVQESLTNVVRHANASTASVRVRYDADAVIVSVDDDGPTASDANAHSAGHGIAGMRERTLALGGTLIAGPRPGGGFRVQASLPIRRQLT